MADNAVFLPIFFALDFSRPDRLTSQIHNDPATRLSWRERYFIE